jgi:GT2 family glycosyltransferase
MALTTEFPGRKTPLEPAPRRRRMSAIVLNHRTIDETLRAVDSLLASNRRPDHLIVVDNDVADECRTRFAQLRVSSPEPRAPSPESRASSPDLTYLHTGSNLGFSGGMNAGIQAALTAGAELVVIANSDIELSPECIERMESGFDRTPEAGIVGPLVLSAVSREQVTSRGIRYNYQSGRMREIGSGMRLADVSLDSGAVDAVSGCLMMVKRDVFDAIGLLDDRYFFGFEDLDFCLRARAAGFTTLVAADAFAFHEGARSIGRHSSRRWYFGARNHLLLASRHVAGEGVGARACRLAWVTALNVAHAVTADAGFLPARLAATFRGVRDHCSGRYGPGPAA